MIQYVITNERVGVARTLYADYSARVQGVRFSTNTRGFAESTGFVPMGLSEAFALYNTVGALRLQIVDTSSGAVYDGRVEDVAITGNGVTITALGYARALSDIPYTALWSTSKVGQWRSMLPTDLSGRAPGLYQMDTNNRVAITLSQAASYRSGGGDDIGAMLYQKPEGGSRQIVGVSFDALVFLPVNFFFYLNTFQVGFTGFTNTTIDTGYAGVRRFSSLLTFSGCDYLEFGVYNNTGSTFTVPTLAPAWNIILTNLRIVTSTANMINTTLTASLTMATSVTITVATTAGMYVGQRLTVGPIATPTNCRYAIITSVVDATHVTATMSVYATGTYPVATPVRSFMVYADEIVKDVVSTANAINSNQISSSTVLIASPALDLFEESYADKQPADVCDYLAKTGDTAGNRWEWGVENDQKVYFRPKGAGARTWYIDVSNLNITRLLDQLSNSVYATYQDASGRTLRTAPTSDPASVVRYGLTRRAALSVSSTSATQAGLQQATALADGKIPQPQAGVEIDRVFDANGARWPLWYVQAGDTMVIRNLPPTLSNAIDRVRVFRLARAEYSFASNTLSLEPETPLPSLDALLFRLSAGLK